MAFYVVCDSAGFANVYTNWWVQNWASVRCYALSSETYIILIDVSPEDGGETARQVEQLGLTIISDRFPLLTQYFDQFPELLGLVPRGAPIGDLNRTFDGVTKTLFKEWPDATEFVRLARLASWTVGNVHRDILVVRDSDQRGTVGLDWREPEHHLVLAVVPFQGESKRLSLTKTAEEILSYIREPH